MDEKKIMELIRYQAKRERLFNMATGYSNLFFTIAFIFLLGVGISLSLGLHFSVFSYLVLFFASFVAGLMTIKSFNKDDESYGKFIIKKYGGELKSPEELREW